MRKPDRIIFFIIISLPVIDILTAFTANQSLSVGMVARTVLLLFLCLIVWNAFSNNTYYKWWIGLSILTICITFGLAFLLKQPFHFLDELIFTFKTIYYVVIMFTMLALIQIKLDPKVILCAMKIAAITIGSSFWVAFLTKTNLNSYAYIKSGFTGWFFSANELSVILIVLFSCTIMSLIKNADLSSFIAFFLVLSMTPMLGTKTAFYGGIMLLLLFLLYLLFKPKQKMTVAVFAVSCLFAIMVPYTPYMDNSGENLTKNENYEKVTHTKQTQQLLSSRDVYLQDTIKDYKKAPWYQKLFGLGYGGKYTKAPKTIEMDFYDLFFSYGIIGAILLLIPFYFVGKEIIHTRLTFTYILSLFTLALCGGIAFVAGHILFAPAVISYVAVFVLLANFEGQMT